MTPTSTRLASLCFDANGPIRLARFWAGVLGWEIDGGASDAIRVLPTDGTRFGLRFLPVTERKTAKNQVHLDLVSESAEHQREVVARLIELGARHADVGQGDADWVVLADPEGNEFCIVLRGEFLAGTGFLGSVVFEPANRATGRFWAEALAWPVVYDQDGDSAIRAPDGRGPFITFGPPGAAMGGTSRLRLGLAPDANADHATEVDRLIALGARRTAAGEDDGAPWVMLADPDGNRFRVLGRR